MAGKILITPNAGSTTNDPTIAFQGTGVSTDVTLRVPSTGGLSFEGTSGQLFSITDTMSGTIYSVNDVSGIPSIEVLDTGLVKLAQYSGNVLIGSGTDTGTAKLQVTGRANAYEINSKQKIYVRHIEGKNWDTYDTTYSGLYLNYNSNQPVYIGSTASIALHAGNYNSYSPTLTGGSASGTWGISITGSAGSATSATYASYVNNGNAWTNGSDGWWRSNGQAGWYSNSYAVGIYATQAGRVDTYNSASFYSAGNITAYSDERTKFDWKPVVSDFIEQLSVIKCGTYSRTDYESRQAGVSAQDLQKFLPEAVPVSDDEIQTLSVAYGNAAMVSAVELAKRVVEQDARIKRLEELINKLIGD